MHGTGNDYIYINCLSKKIKNPSDLAIKMSNRNFGIGSDGLILIESSKTADFKMRIFNPDGSEAEMCGNGIRCFAKYVYDKKLTDKKNIEVETLAGIKTIEMKVKNKLVYEVTVNMGSPILEKNNIPMQGSDEHCIDETIVLDDHTRFKITAISMGNPHVVIFVEDVENFPIHKYGPMIEKDDLFPNRTNVEFVQIINENELKQRTWERGSGETLSCGTGASAVSVAAALNGHTKDEVTIHLSGGDLKLHWKREENNVYMTGPAVEIFSGTWDQ